MKIAMLEVVTPLDVISWLILNGPSVREIVKRDFGLGPITSII